MNQHTTQSPWGGFFNGLNCSSVFTQVSLFILLFFTSFSVQSQISWDQSELGYQVSDADEGVTSMMFGPDGRLYVAEYPGMIKIFTIERIGDKDYQVTAVEELNGIQTMADHNDDGSLHNSVARETTGLTVAGTAANPVIYVASSDFRIGAGSGGGNGDVDLDTNSGVITRFSWNGSSWDVVDLVRGLPRSEENHATNGLEFVNLNGTNYLIVASGGHTNAGSPSTNFVYTCEYALSAAVISVNLDMLNSMPILNDNGRSYIYDLPTLDDPTRPNVNGITDPDDPGYDGVDVNDPWGGNDGLNMAIHDPTGPVDIVSPGYRNAYDLVVTESGALYVTDNGANGGWGGLPTNEGVGTATNEYLASEPGSSSPTGDGEQIDNVDHLQLVTTDLSTYTFGDLYGGHPNPIRANPTGAGLYTDDGTTAVWRTQIYDPDGSTPGSTTDPSIGLPANWSLVVPSANPVEGDWRSPSGTNPDGPDDNPVVTWGTNTNGIDEYTASNFGGIMQGDLIAGVSNGVLRRVELDGNGQSENFTATFASGIGGDALAITCNSDTDIFPGTIWAGTLNGKIVVFEPIDFVSCVLPGDAGYDPNADNDFDGYTNDDELQNGTDMCNGGSQPDDFDKAAGAPLNSNLLDTDDDNDGIADHLDPFQLGDPLATGSDAFVIPITNDLFNFQQGLGGIFGLGMTGLMNNGSTGNNWLDWIDRRDDINDPNPNDVLGGAPGIMTSHMTSGTAFEGSNTQEKGYQYGVQTDVSTGLFTVVGGMNGFTGPLRLYGNTAAVGGELGFFIGDGTQSNYIKFVVTTDGFTALQEINDVAQAPISFSLPVGDRPTAGILFYFVIDPSTGNVQLEYNIDGTGRVVLGSLTAQGSILTAIQQSSSDLAVGFTGTSGVAGVELEGSWDFLNVVTDGPYVTQELPDLVRQTDTSSDQYNLEDYFSDIDGSANLTFSIESNSNPLVGASLSGSVLTLTYPSVSAFSSITVRATDGDSAFVEQVFTVDVQSAFYRINAGGPEVTFNGDVYAADSNFIGGQSFTNTDATVSSLYQTERSSPTDQFEYALPLANGDYQLVLHFAEIFYGADGGGNGGAGSRIFDVLAEGVVILDNYDLFDVVGPQTETTQVFNVTVSDGELNLEFESQGSDGADQPKVSAIEVLGAVQYPAIQVAAIADQNNNTGDTVGSLGVNASGGNPSANFSYSIVGQPDGIQIEPTNGLIFGTISSAAAAGGPNGDGIHQVDVQVSKPGSESVSIAFQWTVTGPFTLTPILDQADSIGASVSLPSQASGGDITQPITYAATGLPAGLSIDTNTGLISGTVLSSALTGGANSDGAHSVEVTASRLGSTDQTTNFIWTITDEPLAYYRINAGGPEVTYNGETFAADSNFSGGKSFTNTSATVPVLYQTERSSATDLFAYDFPLPNGEYDLILHLAEIYFGANGGGSGGPGNRVFDVTAEGITVLDDYDLTVDVGAQVATTKTFRVNVLDGELNLVFESQGGDGVDEPKVSAIEVIGAVVYPPINITAIGLQTNEVGETPSLQVQASGGNPDASFSYAIDGAPLGVAIDPATGIISGLIDALAVVGGSNGDGNHLVTLTVSKLGSEDAVSTFNWSITGPPLPFTLTAITDQNNGIGDQVNLHVEASGGDVSEPIVYSASGLPDGLGIDSGTGLISGQLLGSAQTGGVNSDGVHGVTVTVSRLGSSDQSVSFVWTVGGLSCMWTDLSDAGVARFQSRTELIDDQVYVMGGWLAGIDGSNDLEIYDISGDSWSVGADLLLPVTHMGTVVVGEEIWVIGGFVGDFQGSTSPPLTDAVQIYNPTTNQWRFGPSLPEPSGSAPAALYDNKIHYFGGIESDKTTDVSDHYVLDLDNLAAGWTTAAPMINPRNHHSAKVVDGLIYAIGGQLGHDGPKLDVTTMDVYNPVTDSWSELAPLPIARSHFEPGTTVHNGKIIIVGGQEETSNYSDDVTEYDPVTNTWQELCTLPNNRMAPVAHAYGDRLIVSGGGINGVSNLITTTQWLQLEPVISPHPPLVLAALSDQNHQVGETITAIQAVASGGDPNGVFQYSLSGQPAGISIDPLTGLISGTVDISATAGGNQGVYNAIVTLSKEGSADVSEPFSWTITGPFVLNSLTDQQGFSGDAVSIQATAYGGDIAEPIVYGLTDAPLGVSIDSNSGLLSGTIDATAHLGGPNSDGVYLVSLTANRLGSTEQISAFTWTVQAQPLVFDPLFNQVNQSGETILLATNASGGDEAETTTYALLNGPDGLTINPTTGEISGTISAAALAGGPAGDGLHVVSLTASKPGSSQGLLSFTWLVTDQTWTDHTDTENYTARHESSFVQMGLHFYLLSGRETNEVDSYDISSGTWTENIGSSSFTFNHYQGVPYEGFVWAIAGLIGGNDAYPLEQATEYVYLFDPSSNTWIEGDVIPVNRRRGSAGVVEHNGLFYILGGNVNGHSGGFVPWFDSYNPRTGEWVSLPDAPRARDHFQAVVHEGKLYAIGGAQTAAPVKVLVSEVDVYDFNSGTWSTLEEDLDFPTPRDGAMITVYNDDIVAMGGDPEGGFVYGTAPTGNINTVEGFDPATQKWYRMPDMVYAHRSSQAIVSGGSIYTIAGQSENSTVQNNLEYFGDFNPQGVALTYSALSVPASIAVSASTPTPLTLSAVNGDTGIYVTSLSITGADAGQYSIFAGPPSDFLIPAGSQQQIELSVTDANSSYTAVLEITYNNGQQVTVNLTNDLLSNPGNQFSEEGEVIDLSLFSNAGTESYSFEAIGLPDGLTINALTGQITGTIQVGAALNSPFGVQINAVADSNAAVLASIQFDWVVIDPTILNLTPIADQSNNVSDQVNLQVEVSGGDVSEPIVYSASGLPDGLGIDSGTGLISGQLLGSAQTGGVNSDGVHGVTVTVSRLGSSDQSVSFVWTVGGLSCMWTDLSDAGVARFQSRTELIDDQVYVMGGWLAGIDGSNDLEIYDISGDSWSVGADLLLPVTHMGTVVVGEEIWVIGGFVGDFQGSTSPPLTDAVQIYNPTTNQWRFGPSLPEPSGSAPAALYDNKIHYFGGIESDKTTDVSDHYVLDLDNLAAGWTTAAPMINPRNHHSAKVVDGLIYAIGGQLGHDGPKLDVTTMDVYNPVTDSWSELAPLPIARSHFEPGTTVHNGKIIIVGGQEETSNYSDDVTEYDPVTNTWQELCTLPNNRMAPVAHAYGDRLIVSGGGINGVSNLITTTQWLQLEPVVSPHPPLVLAALSDQNHQVGETITAIQAVASGGDPNGVFQYSLSGQPAGISIDPLTGLISGTVDPGAQVGGPTNNGVYTSLVRVQMPGLIPATVAFTWVVEGPLAIASISDRTDLTNAVVSFFASASGGDTNEPLVYGMTGAPAGIVINSSTGEISGTVSPSALTGGPNSDGIHAVTVSASRLGSADVDTSFSWTIEEVIDPVVLWFEDFEDLADGTEVDTGDTAWTSVHDSGTFQVQGNVFLTTGNSDAIRTWTSEVIAINEMADLSVDVFDGDDSKESVDYIAAYYVVDGGSPVLFGQANGNIDPQTFSVTDVMGSSVQIIIEVDVSTTNEIYYFDNIMVTGLPLDLTQYPLTVVNGSGSGGYLFNTAVTITADSPAVGQEFDVWTGDVIHIADVTSASTTLTMPAQAATVTATYKDKLPVLLNPGDQNSAESEVISLQLQMEELIPGYEFFATGLPAGLSMDTSGLITGTIGVGAAASSPYTVEVQLLQQGSGTLGSSVQFNWVVFDPTLLVINSLSDRTDLTNAVVSFFASASGGDTNEPLVYGMTGAPAGIVINSSTGEISGTVSPSALTGGPNSDGIHAVTVSASRLGSADVDTSFSWTIEEVIDPVVLWFEDFEDLADGTEVDTGDTAWTSVHDSGTFQVQGNVFLTTGNSDAIRTWTSEVIAINEMADLSVDVFDGDDSKESVDYIAAYYVVDGGSPVLFGQANGNIDPQTFSVTDVMGSSVQIIIEVDVSTTNEIYYFDNIMVTGLPLDLTQYPLTVVNGSGSGGYLSNTAVTITADSPAVGQEFDVWTGDVIHIADVTSASTTLTMPAQAATVTATYKDKLPVLLNPGDQNSAESEVISLQLQMEELIPGYEFFATGLPAGLSMDTSGLITGTIGVGAAASSPYTVEVQLLQQGSGTLGSSVQFNWVVFDPTLLVINSLSDRTDLTNAVVSFFASASGGDTNEPLVYGMTGAPAGIVINSSTGEISGTVSPSALTGGPNSDGIHAVTVSASRLGSADVDTSFSWTIEEVIDPVVLWFEDFEDLADGTEVDTGDTAWTSVHDSGTFQVQGNVFLTTGNSDAIRTWTSEVIAINEMADLSVDVFDGDDSKESVDYIAAYYVVDGGSPVLFGQANGNIDPQTFSVTDVMGSSVQIIIEVDVSTTNEIYYFDNIMVTGLPLGPLPLTINAIADQSNEEGDAVSLSPTVFGGNGNAIGYTLSGAPPSLTIHPSTGVISGTLSAADATGGPNNNGIYSTTVFVNQSGSTTVQSTFVWTITEDLTPSAIWFEDFEDLLDGTVVDNGTTAWSSTNDIGVFEVQNNAFLVSGNSNGIRTWTSELISIGGNSIDISLTVDDQDSSKESADRVSAYYSLDGAPPILFGEVTGNIDLQSLGIEGLSGSTLQIIVEMDVSTLNEIYIIDNILVQGIPTATSSLQAGTAFSYLPASEFTIFPNPAKVFAEIDSKYISSISSVRIWTANGAQARSYSGSELNWNANGNLELDVSGLQAGIYYLNLQSPEYWIQTLRLVIKN